MTRQDSIYLVRRELAYRENDGIEVWLLWHESSGDVFVVVHDRHAGELFELDVDPSAALDAFDHPYAFAASCGVAYGAGAGVPCSLDVSPS